MGKNREQKKEKKWNKKSSEKEVLNSKYVRSKVKLMEKRQQQQTKHSKNRR
jgi:hypothetical protein